MNIPMCHFAFAEVVPPEQAHTWHRVMSVFLSFRNFAVFLIYVPSVVVYLMGLFVYVEANLGQLFSFLFFFFGRGLICLFSIPGTFIGTSVSTWSDVLIFLYFCFR